MEVLERKGSVPNKASTPSSTSYDRKTPRARIPETAFPEPYLLTENQISDDIQELLNKHGLTSHQSHNLLGRVGRIIEMRQRVAKGTTHSQCRTDNTFVNAGNLRSSQSKDTSRKGEVRTISRKVKKFIHETLSPVSVDKPVHKIALPSKFSPFLHSYNVFA